VILALLAGSAAAWAAPPASDAAPPASDAAASDVATSDGTSAPKEVVARPLPAVPLWDDPIADSRAPRSSLTVRTGERPTIDATLGLPLPLVEFAWNDTRVQIGLATAIFLGFVNDGPLIFDFETFDGWFALPVDVSAGPWSARLEWAHLSAHYGDGIRDNSARPGNIDPFSREWVRLWGARTLGPARVYGSAWALLHTLPEAPPFGFSAGAEVEGPWRVAPYAAVDLRLAQEDAWAPAIGGQAGARLRSGTHRLRLGVAARSGPEDTGKLRPGTEAWVGGILTYDRVGGP